MTDSAPQTKLLLVEDNEMNRDMLTRRLQRRGFQVIPALDGETALSVARESSPDLILMDIGLPGKNGWDATRSLKHDPRTRQIPIVALTAHALSSDREQALAAGCDAFETKPVEIDRLLRTIESLLSARKGTYGI
jgi:CheY-like chemotaxis protein